MNTAWLNEHPVKLDAAGLTWFNNLKNQYLSLPPAQTTTTDVQKRISAKIDELVKTADKDLVMQDNFNLEDWVLTLMSGPALASKLKSLRDDYKEVFGQETWNKIQLTLLAQVDPTKDDDNRAESQRLLAELHWQASIRPWASHLRQQMLGYVIVLLGLAMLVMWLNVCRHGPEMAGSLMLVGLLGGAVSTIQRIQSADLACSRALMLARYSMLKLGVIVSPVLGGIFALVLTLFLLTKSVTAGFIVPDMTVGCATNCAFAKEAAATNLSGASNLVVTLPTNLTGGAPTSAWASTTNPVNRNASPTNAMMSQTANGKAVPAGEMESCLYTFFSLPVHFASGKDLALLLLLAFVAGFSERLVPDLLTKLADTKKP
jgi:hypothetical protein